ncbi:hypothetical protein [Branchiibius cervicis]|uniref:Phospholipase D-like domain-containing protein n=1 Tax=Branchiibius cervicis TaxID=908252 RepID=A0ABW2AXA7_9MICO
MLITRLDAAAVAGGYLSVRGLQQLLEAGVEIRDVPRVHAKVFVIGGEGFLGSANLTGAGLGTSALPNHELGVELDAELVAEARRTLLSWNSQPVTADDLVQLEADAKLITAPKQDAARHRLNPRTAQQLAEALLVDARDPGRGLWLKLEYGEPDLEGWRSSSYFASPKKGRPKFKPGDLVFICAQETHDCYAVVEVSDGAQFQPADYVARMQNEDPAAIERWPWVTRTDPRLVPEHLLQVKLAELGIAGRGLQNGHVRLSLDQFASGVRGLARTTCS